MFEVLLYLFDNYDNVLRDSTGRQAIVDALFEAGFNRGDIGRAFRWLDELVRMSPAHELPMLPGESVPGHRAIRHYNDMECAQLLPEARGFIQYLERKGVLNCEAREIVIDRALALDHDAIGEHEIKWLALIVLYNHPGFDRANTWFEELRQEAAIPH